MCRYVVSKFDHQENSQVIASIIKLMVGEATYCQDGQSHANT